MREELEGRMLDRLRDVEGVKPTVYKDSRGLWTIGIGILVDPSVPGAGLREEEMEFLAVNRLNLAEEQLGRTFSWYHLLSEARQAVMIELLFNMGLGNTKKGLLSFRNTLPAIARGDWAIAERGLRSSAWYRQVKPTRADPLIRQLVTGQWQY